MEEFMVEEIVLEEWPDVLPEMAQAGWRGDPDAFDPELFM